MMKAIYIMTMTVLVLCFQNFNFVNLMDKKYFVDEQSRVNHAREILGKGYGKSDVSKLEGEKFFHVYLYDVVSKSLPKKHKKSAKKIVQAILKESKEHGIDPIFIASIIKTESSFNPDAVGTSGEIGLMQLMPSTAKEIAERLKIKWQGTKTLQNPEINIRMGTAYISRLRGFFDKKASRYISAYNVGPGKILKIDKNKDVPKFYITKILKHYEELYKKIALTKVPDNLAAN